MHNPQIVNQLVESLKNRRFLAIEIEVSERTRHCELSLYICKFWDDVSPESATDEQLVRLEVYLRAVHFMSIQDAYKLVNVTRQLAHAYDQRINEVYQNGK